MKTKYAMKKEFTHLHLQSSYSLNCSTIALDVLIKSAKKNKIKSLALTDSSNVFGAIKFYQKCIDNKIKPIIGCKIKLQLNGTQNKNIHSILLLCQNLEGYKNNNKIE